jgi:predicted deacetylase
MNASLIVSVSGIRDETRAAAADFAAELDRKGVRLSLLVAPRLKDKYRLTRDAPTQDWLRERKQAGDAIVLHGYDQAATKRRRAEFATLPAHEARLRLTAADRVMEEIGLRTRVFAAPRWIASPGAVSALPAAGFRVLAGATAVHDLERGTSVRSRVFGIGEGFGAGSGGWVWEPGTTEPWWCRALVMGAGRVARRGGVVRLAISAKQVGRPGPRQAMIDAIDLAQHHGAESAVYEWLPRESSRRIA